jgi:endonuclease G
MTHFDAWVRDLLTSLGKSDRQLVEEIRAAQTAERSGGAPSVGRSRIARTAARAGRALRVVRERRAAVRQSLRNIVLRVGRPVLAVVEHTARLEFADSASAVWRTRLETASDKLQQAARAVGRLEVTGLPTVRHVGTAWLVAPQVIVTNRHVALSFAGRLGAGFGFRPRPDGQPHRVVIDFLEEPGRRRQLEFAVVEVLHIEDASGPDFAFLRIEPRSGRHQLAQPVPLGATRLRRQQQVAVIGYPARDVRVPDQQLMLKIFGDVFDKKRLAPGQITERRRDVLLHDCSTLGGNSGSVLVDLDTGSAAGLHFAGRFMDTNLAVPADLIAARLETVLRKPVHPPAPLSPPVAAGPAPPTTRPEPDNFGVFVEGVVADYVGRQGYDSAFLGPKVPLPLIGRRSDVLTFVEGNRRVSELKYQHFSVVMNRRRRLCIFSAVNIDGGSPGRFKRPSWRLDPRIPQESQIREECYGDPPLFSRGHMTRREDPIWGSVEAAALGNSDSMHVTNTVPQMQPFNAGIWLGLEDYALKHARTDKMRISVFTGPFFLPDDPVREGVQIPRAFWKVITFIHDQTRELCATGYTMSQEGFLSPEEFVFAGHLTSQTRIADIESRARISFGRLASIDPFRGDEEGATTVLAELGQIQFLPARGANRKGRKR